MADPYWNRQAPPLNHPPSSAAGLLKRPRSSDYDLPQSGTPSAHEMRNYLARDLDRSGSALLKDSESIGSAYDRYLQSMQRSSMSSAEPNSLGRAGLGRSGGDGILNFPPSDPIPMSRSGAVDERAMGLMGRYPADALNSQGMSLDRQNPIKTHNARDMGFDDRIPPADAISRPRRETLPLPSNASNTLYVEGLPSNCKKREVAHIFRPFVGYKEVRLVSKDSKHRGEPLVLCFVDFISPACAATAMSALQGYKMDEDDRDSAYLRIQFSKAPGPKSGSHGRR